MTRRRCARSMKTMKAMTAIDITSTAMMRPVEMAPWRPSFERIGDGRGKGRDNARKNDQRRPIADAARGNLLAKPHQKHRAAHQGQHGRDAEENTGIGYDAGLALEPIEMP